MVSCTSNTIFKKPDDLIPKDSMVILLSDLYMATASKAYRNKFNDRNVDYTFLVYEKYGIDSARFRRSNFYYTTKIDDYEKIYKEVEAKLKALNTNYKTIKKISDSIRRDSTARVRVLRDSLNKIKKAKAKIHDSIINLKMADSLSPEEILILTDSLFVAGSNNPEEILTRIDSLSQTDNFSDDSEKIINRTN
jgi:prefoldin subunit 5